MKAITLWQPWASAIALGVKTIETRSWGTTYRGPLAIHAAARRLKGNDEFRLWRMLDMAPLSFGAVVATCELDDVVRFGSALILDPNNREWGDYTPGRYGWLLRNIRPLDPPIPANGRQQLWNWEGSR